MTAHSRDLGHEIVYLDGRWVMADAPEGRDRRCKTCGRPPVLIDLPVCTRGAVEIDACIAGIVTALNAGGVLTVSSCCGHGYQPGNIFLQDGRELTITRRTPTGRPGPSNA